LLCGEGIQRTIEADGNDLTVVIPAEMLDRAELQIGGNIELSVENGVLIFERFG